MLDVRLCVEQYLDGTWGPVPDDRPTDLPPLQVKDHKRWDAEGWPHFGDIHGYEGAYEEFAERVRAAFKLIANTNELLIIETSPLVTYDNGGETDTENTRLMQAINQAGLPTREDVERHSDWGD